MSPAVTAPKAACPADASVTRSEEAELVRDAVGGDAGAARELVRRFHQPIFRYVCRMTGQTQDAEDITQETFVKAFRSLDRVDTSRPLAGWLFTIARRTALNHFRARRPTTELLPDITADTSPGPRQQTEGREGIDHLWSQAQLLLSEPEYEALWLRFGEDLSTAETAETTGRSISGIKTLIHRARQRLLSARGSCS